MKNIVKMLLIAGVIFFLSILGYEGIIPDFIPLELGGAAFLFILIIGWLDEGKIRKHKDKEKLKRKKIRRDEI